MARATLERVDAITLFVEDPQRSKAFYAQVFGVEPIFEDAHSVAFRLDRIVVNLLARSEAPGLIGPAPVGDRESGSRFQLTIGVDDTDAVCRHLAEAGVALVNGPIDRSWGLRTAAFADPDGHIWEVAQELG